MHAVSVTIYIMREAPIYSCNIDMGIFYTLVFLSERDVHKITNSGHISTGYMQLTLFDRGAMMAPQNVFDHCAQTLCRRKLKLGGF